MANDIYVSSRSRRLRIDDDVDEFGRIFQSFFFPRSAL